MMPPPLTRTSSSDSLPDLADAEVSDNEAEPVARDAAASTSHVRALRKAASKATGMRGVFSGKRTPEPLLGGMPLAADVCGKCGERPGDLTCCACAASICARCSTLTGDALARAREFDNRKEPTKRLSLYVCKRCGGGLSSTRCAGCSLRVRNDPLEDTVISKVNGTTHHRASLNCDYGSTFTSKCPPCSRGMECRNCFDPKNGNRIDDRGPFRDRVTAGAARELKNEFGFNEGEVLIEKGSGRRATVVEDGGTGLEVKVVFQGSDVPEVVVPHLVFSHYVEDDAEIELEWPDRRCRLCRLKKANEEQSARLFTARAAMDAERAQEVQGVVYGERRYWLIPNPSDPQGRSDQQTLADAYANIEAASLPQDDDDVTGRRVCFRVRHTSRCPPVAW